MMGQLFFGILNDGKPIRTISRKSSDRTKKKLKVSCFTLIDNQIWSLDTRMVRFKFTILITMNSKGKMVAHDKCIMLISLTNSGKLITSSSDRTIKIWSLKSDKINFVKKLDQSKNEVIEFVVLNDIVRGSFYGLEIFDLITGYRTQSFETKFSVDKLKFWPV